MGITIYWICHDNSEIKLHCHVPGSHQRKGNIFCISLSAKLVQNISYTTFNQYCTGYIINSI